MSAGVDAHALALRYGVALPRPPKLRVVAPGFAVGSCNAMLFSPCGQFLVVPTANGTYLWDVARGTKLLKLVTPSNPGYFSFSPDGRELLVRGYSTGEMARLAIPSGDPVARFKPKYKYRLDGTGCLGPGGDRVLQLGYEGRFLMLDATSGKVLLERQLEATGCSGEVYWVPELGQVIVAQASVADAGNRNEPCALWRWTWPLAQHEPQRLAGTWSNLATRYLPTQGVLLMHHQPDARAPDRFVIDVVDLRTLETTRRIACGGTSIPRPALAHDRRSWAVTTYGVLQLGTDDGRADLPIRIGAADFSPVADLVAVSGPAGFVAPLAQLDGLRVALQLHFDEGELHQRGYARGTTWPDRKLPPRFVVYCGPDGLCFETEAIAGRKYMPVNDAIRVAPAASPEQVLTVLDEAGTRARQPLAADSGRERRDFQVGTVTPPAGDWTHAVAVTLATDAIDLWPMKHCKDGTFKQDWYPVAAIPAGTQGAPLWTAIEAMLGTARKP